MARGQQAIGLCTRCNRGTVNCSHNKSWTGRGRFILGSTVAATVRIGRRRHFDQTKEFRSRLAMQRFARSAVGKRLDETDIFHPTRGVTQSSSVKRRR